MFIRRSFTGIGVLLALVCCVLSCRKEEELSDRNLNLGSDQWVKNDLDNWLYETFTRPYNIEVKYRWDNTENNYSYTLVPPSLDKVKPIMEVVKHAWIDVYTAEAGETFMKKYAPRQYTLIGSLRYNNTTVTLGEAEGGNKVMLLGVDEFDRTNRDRLKRVLKTIHHEFTHILNQNVRYPEEYREISRGLYTGTWNQIALGTARELGFISSYAMAAEGEDFAEMASILITEGKPGFDAMVNSVVSADARADLRQKESLVATYFKQVWNVDIYSLQQRVQEAMDDYAPIPLHASFGFGKAFTSLLASPAHIATLGGDFATAYAAAKTGLNGFGGRQLDEVYFQMIAADKGSLRVRYINSAGSAFLAFFGYDVTISSQGVATFTYTGPLTNTNSNSNTVGPHITALTAYFNGQFQVSWPGGRPMYTPPFNGGLYKVGNPDSYFTGVLGN